MAKTFTFPEFETVPATVQVPSQDTDDSLGGVQAFSARTAVGDSGVVMGSLQSLGGSRQEYSARFNAVVDYVFYVAASTVGWDQIANGDRLAVGTVRYDVIHVEDESGAGQSPVVYLRRVD